MSPDALLRMPLDRSFVMKGFGTVVTGTLISGTIQDGHTLRLEPQGRAVRVRGLQTHGQTMQSVPSGSRVAVNLSGVDATEVHRGQTLVSPGTMRRSTRSTRGQASQECAGDETSRKRSLPRLHVRNDGAAFLSTVRSDTAGNCSPDAHPACGAGVLVPGDRFVLRQPSPAGTIGGRQCPRCLSRTSPAKGRNTCLARAVEEVFVAQQVVLRVARRKTTGITLHGLSQLKQDGRSEAIRRQMSPALQCEELLLLSGDLLFSREAFVAATGAIMFACSQPGL